MVMSTNQAAQVSLGACFVHLFKVDVDHFQLLAQKPRVRRDSEYLNRPYELSDLMRQASDAGIWPR